jgi:hypothetical protein
MDILLYGTPFKLTESQVKRFHRSYDIIDGCWISNSGVMSNGYGRFYFHQNGKQIQRRLHSVSYAMHKGPLYENEVVRHQCGNRLCCNPDHLEKGTQKENMHDIFRDVIKKTRPLIEEGLTDEEIYARLFA